MEVNAKDQYKADFEMDFDKSFPFQNVIDENKTYKDALFHEYCDAPLKPSLYRYTAQFYTDDEIEKGLEESNKRTPTKTGNHIVAADIISSTDFERKLTKIHSDFWYDVINKKLAEKFYSPDIRQTNIYKRLKKVEDEFVIIKETLSETAINAFVTVVFYELEGLNNECLAKDILLAIKNDSENIYVILNEIESKKDSIHDIKYSKKWKQIKSLVDARIIEHIKNMPALNTNKLNITPNKRTINIDGLSPYFKASFKQGSDNKINYFEWLVSRLEETDRTPKVFAQIALMIYESKIALNNKKPDTFKKWYSIFCNNVDCEQKTYKPNQLRNPSEKTAKLFNFL